MIFFRIIKIFWSLGGPVNILRTIQYSFRFRKLVMVRGPITIYGKYKNIIIKRDKISINPFCVLGTREGTRIIISDGVRISAHCILLTFGLNVDNHGRNRTHMIYGDIILEENVWLGAGCKIIGGVRIGANSVIAAGAVVVHDIPPGSLVVGVPGKVIRQVK